MQNKDINFSPIGLIKDTTQKNWKFQPLKFQNIFVRTRRLRNKCLSVHGVRSTHRKKLRIAVLCKRILSTHRRPDLVGERLAKTSGDPTCVLSSREKIKVPHGPRGQGPVGKLAGKQICDPSLHQ